jgi:hypothetical protein
MITHLYPRFLHDDCEYRRSEDHWLRLWEQLDPQVRDQFAWQQPWFQPLPASLGEGNPIFSAVSPVLRRGIRVIQHEPTTSELEIQAWTDSFGGRADDPGSIAELVISCALSDQSSQLAFSLVAPWVSGGAVDLRCDDGGRGLLPPMSPEDNRADVLHGDGVRDSNGCSREPTSGAGVRGRAEESENRLP